MSASVGFSQSTYRNNPLTGSTTLPETGTFISGIKNILKEQEANYKEVKSQTLKVKKIAPGKLQSGSLTPSYLTRGLP